MAAPPPPEGPPSLLGSTIRRSIVAGRLFFIVGILYALFLAVGLSLGAASSFGPGFSVILPIFTVIGALGGLMVFTSDRVKGTFEYLIAYGVLPRRLFTDILVASLVLVTIELTITIAIGLGIYLATGHAFSADILADLAVFTLPMSYACVALTAIVGMFWTSLSSPRAGINSPIGFIPFIGILPQILTIVLAAVFSAYVYDVLIGGFVVVVVIVVVLLGLTNRLMPRERLLSPA
jgi:hypothetical protein